MRISLINVRRKMKTTLSLFFLLLAFSGTCRADTETLFTIRDLKGEMQVYSGAIGSVLPQIKKNDDAQSDAIYIQREKEGEKEKFYIAHNNGRHPVILIQGEKSISFLESYGDNNFIWTVCLDKRNPDGSSLAIVANIKAAGVAGYTTSSIMSGGAYTLLQPRTNK